jgi:hypothetical protein
MLFLIVDLSSEMRNVIENAYRKNHKGAQAQKRFAYLNGTMNDLLNSHLHICRKDEDAHLNKLIKP